MNSLQRLAVRYVLAGIMGTRSHIRNTCAQKDSRSPWATSPERTSTRPSPWPSPSPATSLGPSYRPTCSPNSWGPAPPVPCTSPCSGTQPTWGQQSLPAPLPLQVALLELVLTLLLMFVVSAVATDVRAVGQAAAIAIGGYVTLAATFAGPIAGAQRPVGGACSAALARGAAGDTCGHPRILGHRLPTPRAFG